MQVRSLPRHVIRNATVGSRLIGAEPHASAAAIRRDALIRWQRARARGLSAADAAEAVGVPRATLYRWAKRPEPGSRRPHRLRRPNWPPALVEAVEAMRRDYPMWGKAKLVVLLRREGWVVSESTTGRILAMLVARGRVVPVPVLRRRRHCSVRRKRPHARRLPKGLRPSRPGEIVQLDTLSVSLGADRRTLKQFTACDPLAKWTCAQAFRRASAHNAKDFLDKLQADMPFPIQAIQVDGGSEFKADFEAECARRGIALYELPPRTPALNGHVERNNGAWRYEFYATWELPTNNLDDINRWIDAFADEFNTFRPHQVLGGQTPAEYLAQITARETQPSHNT